MGLNVIRPSIVTLALICVLPAQANIEKSPVIVDPSMQLGSALLEDAVNLEMDSVSMIRHGNSLRKKINKLRVMYRAMPEGKEKEAVLQTINDYSEEIPKWQDQAGKIRQYGQGMHERGIYALTQGFHEQWKKHIALLGPMVTEADKEKLFSHNSPIRSMHPTMLGKMRKTEVEKKDTMTMSVPSMMGQDVPPDLNLETFKVSRDRNVFAHVEPVIQEGDELPLVPINQIHKWKLIVSDLKGQPLKDAEITIEGHMPGHVHGLPTQPEVTKQIEAGLYEVDGVKFQMIGWWVMTFHIKTADYEDEVTFNLKL